RPPGIIPFALTLTTAWLGAARPSLAQDPPTTLETSHPSAPPPALQPFSDTELQLLGMFGPARLADDATDGAFILTFQHFSTWELGYHFFFLDLESQRPWHFLDERLLRVRAHAEPRQARPDRAHERRPDQRP